jgi:hypothetical protein
MSIAKLSKAWAEAEAVLEELRGDPSDLARLRRLHIQDRQCDVLYELSNRLKDAGRSEDANLCHRAANRIYSEIVSEIAPYDHDEEPTEKDNKCLPKII